MMERRVSVRNGGLMRLKVLSAAVAALALAAVITGTSFASHAGAARVTVTFTDTTFRLSTVNLESGPTTFVVINKGKKHHVFTIKGPGVKGMHTATLTAGSSATLTVALHAGAYVLSDPVGLGPYNVQFLDVVRAAVLTGTGSTNVVSSTASSGSSMCGTIPGTSYAP
jgi:hypothetical protein